MNDRMDHRIPAANIGETDLVALAETDPEAAREIARLVNLMNRGEESDDECLRLCRLLFDAGSARASEHLLRRNLSFYHGHVLYIELFGTAKQDEFDAAIEAFKSQFEVELILEAENDFLVLTFHTAGSPQRSDAFTLLSSPCTVQFGYIEQDTIQAHVLLYDPDRMVRKADECLLLFFTAGVWEVVNPIGR